MLDNNLIFSLIISIINTIIFALMTNRDDFEQKKQDYIKQNLDEEIIILLHKKSCINNQDIIFITSFFFRSRFYAH